MIEMRTMLKSKIHRARVTAANIDYEGSVTIDKELMREAAILPYEQVHILNLNNGERLTTYAIEGAKGEVCLNGAAARSGVTGDSVIILSYASVEEEKAHHYLPRVVYVDAGNNIQSIKSE